MNCSCFACSAVNVRLNGLPLYAAPDPDNADRVTAALASDGLIPA